MGETIITLFIVKISEDRPRGDPGFGIRREFLKEGRVSSILDHGKERRGNVKMDPFKEFKFKHKCKDSVWLEKSFSLCLAVVKH